MSEDAGEKTVLVTGGNSGVGFGCARHLARAGRRVLIASRDRERSSRAARAINEETGSRAVEELPLDLSSCHAVRDFARELRQRRIGLGAIVLNAGVQIVRGIAFTEDGVEKTFGINHLGHFLLTNLLLENLVANAPARIVVVSSGVHDPTLRTGMPKPGYAGFESLARGEPDGSYNGRLAYVNSKLCNMLFAYELVRRIQAAALSTPERPLTVNAFDPGLVPGSGLARDYNPAARWIWSTVLPVLRWVSPRVNSADAAGRALARLVLAPGLERTSGRYFASHAGYRDTSSSEESYDPARGRALWETSVALCKLKPGESPLRH